MGRGKQKHNGRRRAALMQTNLFLASPDLVHQKWSQSPDGQTYKSVQVGSIHFQWTHFFRVLEKTNPLFITRMMATIVQRMKDIAAKNPDKERDQVRIFIFLHLRFDLSYILR